MARLGRQAFGGPFTGRPAHRLDEKQTSLDCMVSPVPEVHRTPPSTLKSAEKPLNFKLALRLLSFIYSDLLVLYIYDLDPALFCNLCCDERYYFYHPI
jgi:hypothetical protein